MGRVVLHRHIKLRVYYVKLNGDYTMQQPQTPYPQQPIQNPTQSQELFIAKYANGGTASVTPYELVLTRGRNQTVIPMGSITAIRFTKNPNAWFVVVMCLTI